MISDNIKKGIKRIIPNPVIEYARFLKLRNQKLSNAVVYQEILRGKSGIEIGGPSSINFAIILPIYPFIKALDGVNFSENTMWEGSIRESKSFRYFKNRCGRQIIADASELHKVKSVCYDFLLSSNCLEHVANPLKALEEWVRVIVPDGHILVVLPNRENNFDHKRSVTAFEHILEDYQNKTSENDLTHLDEILELHDLSRDPAAGGHEKFKARSLNNFSNRGMHHHVFDMSLIEELFGFFSIEIIQRDETANDYFVLGKVPCR